MHCAIIVSGLEQRISMIILNTIIGGKAVIVKHSPAEYSSFLGQNTLEKYELYIDNEFIDSFDDLDELNEWFD